MHILTGVPATSTSILSTAKLERWVLLHCTIVLFPSWVTWTVVVTPSVDQAPLPILFGKEEITIIINSFILYVCLCCSKYSLTLITDQVSSAMSQYCMRHLYKCTQNVCTVYYYGCWALTHKWLKQKDLRLSEVPEYTGKILASCLQVIWHFKVTPRVIQAE